MIRAHVESMCNQSCWLATHSAAIDYIYDVVNGDGSLRNVGRDHDLSNTLGWAVKYTSLITGSQGAVQWVDFEPIRIAKRVMLFHQPESRTTSSAVSIEDV